MKAFETGKAPVVIDSPASSIRSVALASLIGTTIERCDFFLYGTAAALVFNRLYFPMSDPLAGTLAAFGTYAVGFVARPIGGIVRKRKILPYALSLFPCRRHFSTTCESP